MKKKINKERVITVKLEETLIESLDVYAKKMKLNRSQLIRNLMENGINDLSIMQNTGMLTMAAKGYDLLDVVKKALGSKNFTVENDTRLIIEL